MNIKKDESVLIKQSKGSDELWPLKDVKLQ